MKKFGSLVLVLVMVLSAVSAMAALPEGYVYEPWRGDKGGVISAEISRLNDQGVADTAAIQALPPKWQDKPNNNSRVVGKAAYNYYYWMLEGAGVTADILEAFELLAEYGIEGRAAMRRILNELDMDWDDFAAFIEDAYIGGLNGEFGNVYVSIADVQTYLKAIADALPSGSLADPIRAWNDTTDSTKNIGLFYNLYNVRSERWLYVDDIHVGPVPQNGLVYVSYVDPTTVGSIYVNGGGNEEWRVYYGGEIYHWDDVAGAYFQIS